MIYRFYATLHVAFDDEVERLHLALFYLCEHVVEGNAALLLNHAFAFFVLSLFLDLFHKCLIDNDNTVACIRHFFKPEHGYRHRRPSRLDGATLVVKHCTHTTHRRTRKDIIARF